MARTASFSGANNAAWPTLSNGDAWDTVAVAVADTAYYTTIGSNLDGASGGRLFASFNNEPTWSLFSSGTDTATNAATYLLPLTNVVPSTYGYLVFLTTTSASAHFHQIDVAGSTGSWTTATWTKVADYTYTSAVVDAQNVRMTAWAVGGITGTTTGKFRLRCRTVAGIAVGGTYTSAVATTGTDVITTNAHFQVLNAFGYKSGSNNYAAFVSTNSTTLTGTGTAATVTLPNVLGAYNNRAIAYVSHLANEATSATAPTTVGGSVNNANPALGSSVVYNAYGSTTVSGRKSSALSVSWATSSVYGAIGLELADDLYGGKDAFASGTIGPVVYRTAGGTTYTNTDVYANATENVMFPMARVVTVAGQTKAIGAYYASYSNGKNTVYGVNVVVVNADGTYTIIASPNQATALTGDTMALRVRPSPTGAGLWISAKFYTRSGTEPDWPSDPTTASNIAAGVVNVVDNATQAVLDIAAAGAGKNGVAVNLIPGVQSASFTPDTGVQVTRSFTYFTDDAVRVATTGSGSGLGGLLGTARQIFPTTGSGGTSAGSLTASSCFVWQTTGSTPGNGSAAASGVRLVAVASAAPATGTLSASATVVPSGVTATLTGTSSATASGTSLRVATGTAPAAGGASGASAVVEAAQTALQGLSGASGASVGVSAASGAGTGAGALTGNTVARLGATASMAGQGSVTAVASIVAATISLLRGDGITTAALIAQYMATAAATGTSTMSSQGISYRPDPLGVRETYTAKVGTGLFRSTATATGQSNTVKVGTGETSSSKVGAETVSTVKIGTGITSSRIKET